MIKKKAATKKNDDIPETPAPVTAHRVLKAGTLIVGAADRRPGSNQPVTAAGSRVPLRLVNDTPVEFDGSDRDEVFVSILTANAENFALNIGSVPGKWSPTGVRLPNECGTCGSEIAASAPDQTTCAACIAKGALPPAEYTGGERRVLKVRRTQVVPLNEAPERRVGPADRRAIVETKPAAAPKTAKQKAASKKSKKVAAK